VAGLDRLTTLSSSITAAELLIRLDNVAVVRAKLRGTVRLKPTPLLARAGALRDPVF
jgi:hypothetical protein